MAIPQNKPKLGVTATPNDAAKALGAQATATGAAAAPRTTAAPQAAAAAKANQTSTANPASVAGELDKMLASDSPLMRRARTTGFQVANRRGLLNSSIAAGEAQNAMIEAAAPIASQDAQMGFQAAENAKNRAEARSEANWQREFTAQQNEIERGFQERMKNKDLDNSERIAASQLVANYATSRASAQQAIFSNTAMKAKDREDALRWINSEFQSNVDFVEELYGIDLDFASGLKATPKPKPKPKSSGGGASGGKSSSGGGGRDPAAGPSRGVGPWNNYGGNSPGP